MTSSSGQPISSRSSAGCGGSSSLLWPDDLNDVLFSLLTVCRLVIDISGELSARRGERFEDYTQAVRNLARDPRFPPALVRDLEPLPGFRNVLVHEYVALDMDRVIEALDRLEPIERFAAIVRRGLEDTNRG